MREALRRYAALPAPRYTSYPTAADFSAAVGPSEHAAWLDSLDSQRPVSLYLHVPYCRELCHYCGCTTKMVIRDEVLNGYRDILTAEIDRVGRHLASPLAASRIHWGGGTPSLLGLEGLGAVLDTLFDHVGLASGAEHAIELDPRHVTPALALGLKRLGITRVSLGVQDLDPAVQLAIGRIQPAATVFRAVEALRAAGLERINFDLIYGLPGQTRPR